MAIGAGDLTDPIDVFAEQLEGLLKGVSPRCAQTVRDEMLGEDQTDQATTCCNSPNRLLIQVVGATPEAIANMRRDYRDRVIGVEVVKQGEGIRDRSLAHMGCIDQYAFTDHRHDSRPA